MNLPLLALALALLPAQDKVTLKFNPKKGDKLARTERTEMSLKAKVTAGEQEQDLEMEQRDGQKATMEYVDVADGAVTKLLFNCQEHVEERKGPPTFEWEKKERPLHGRKVTLSTKDGQLVRDGADGLDAKVLNRLVLEDRASRIFPKNPVAPGDTWEIQGDDVRKFFAADNDVKEAKIKAKFLEVKELEGRKCALLNAAIELHGKAPGDIDLIVSLDAEVVVWIERGYTLSVKGKGSVKMNAETPQYKVAGQGPITLEILTKVE